MCLCWSDWGITSPNSLPVATTRALWASDGCYRSLLSLSKNFEKVGSRSGQTRHALLLPLLNRSPDFLAGALWLALASAAAAYSSKEFPAFRMPKVCSVVTIRRLELRIQTTIHDMIIATPRWFAGSSTTWCV